jgi:hypothetical protein
MASEERDGDNGGGDVSAGWNISDDFCEYGGGVYDAVGGDLGYFDDSDGGGV